MVYIILIEREHDRHEKIHDNRNHLRSKNQPAQTIQNLAEPVVFLQINDDETRP